MLMMELLLWSVLRGIMLLWTWRKYSLITVKISTETNMRRILKHPPAVDVWCKLPLNLIFFSQHVRGLIASCSSTIESLNTEKVYIHSKIFTGCPLQNVPLFEMPYTITPSKMAITFVPNAISWPLKHGQPVLYVQSLPILILAEPKMTIYELSTFFSLDHDKAVVQNEFKYKNCCIDGQGKLLNLLST